MDNFANRLGRPKIIFVILGLVILIEIIYAVRVLTASVSTTSAPPPQVTVTPTLVGGKISLVSPKTSFKLNEEISVSVLLDSGGHLINGADLIIRFDPKILQASSSGLIRGGIFDTYPLLSAEQNKGLISISGIATGEGFKGRGQFATINFIAKKAGATSLNIDFQKGSTIDSNLVEEGTSEDILENVENLQIEIQ